MCIAARYQQAVEMVLLLLWAKWFSLSCVINMHLDTENSSIQWCAKCKYSFSSTLQLCLLIWHSYVKARILCWNLFVLLQVQHTDCWQLASASYSHHVFLKHHQMAFRLTQPLSIWSLMWMLFPQGNVSICNEKRK